MAKKTDPATLPQTQDERRLYLIRALLGESNCLQGEADNIPSDADTQRQMLRALMNVRPPRPAGGDFLAVQDAYLQELLYDRGLTDVRALLPVRDHVYLWFGDISALRADAIVNDAAEDLQGCMTPLHDCVDNLVHTYAGVQLRLACASLVNAQGHLETPGGVKVTDAYNLPSTYVFHTVAPVARVTGSPAQAECDLLASCYRSCLGAALERHLSSIAFCPLGVGGGFPEETAARVAVSTVDEFVAQHAGDAPAVVFVVASERQKAVWRAAITGKRA